MVDSSSSMVALGITALVANAKTANLITHLHAQ
jgi:hypothetical protein